MTAPVDRVRDALDWVKSDATPAEIRAVVEKALKPVEPTANYSMVRVGSILYVRVDEDDEPWRAVVGDYYSWNELCAKAVHVTGFAEINKGDAL